MQRKLCVYLDEDELGQIIDGLTARQEAWSKTAKFFREGLKCDELFLIEDCNDEREAVWLAGRYASLIRLLEQQRDTQMEVGRSGARRGGRR